MLDEFILLLESEKEKVKAVLKPHLHEKIFKQLIGGFFDDTQKRLVAFAFMPVKKSMFYEYDYLFELSNSGHSGVYFSPETAEKTRKYTDQNTFQYKSTEELIDEGIYKSILVSYMGEFDFGEWNILRDCCFCDKNNKNKLLESKVDSVKTTVKDYFFNSSIFHETLERHESVSRYLNSKRENMALPLPTEMRPFIGHSQLVAFVRTEKTAKINLAFKDYIEKAIYNPLVIKLRTGYPNKYNSVWGFYGHNCNFLVPSHRQFCLIICGVTNSRKKAFIEFYFYDLRESTLYVWIYFQLYPYEEKPDYKIIVKIFSHISILDNIDYIIKPECNFDDAAFWNNYVFKKDDSDKYIYLQKINFIDN